MRKRNLLTILLIIMTFGLLLVGCKKRPTTTVNQTTTTENGNQTQTQGTTTEGSGNQTTTTVNREVLVSFNTNGGTDVQAQTVVKGEKVTKPSDPEKAGYAFLGWYKDNAFTEEFDFDEAITETTTVYAYFVEDTEKDNYNVTLVYGNGEENTVLTAYDGKLYNVPTPVKEGYTFEGWYVSLYNDSEKLSYKVNANTIFNESTSIYAVWTANAQADTLKAPIVSVDGDSISWNAVEGATQYKVTIYSGEEKIYEKVVATVGEAYDFANLESGDYVVEVIAIAANEAMNSVAGKSYYLNKSLPRVTIYEVNGNVISWNAVEGATSYKVAYTCGNEDHNHETFDVTGTSFDTSICTMVEGGLKVRILACKEGYKSSYSEEITVLVKLADVTNLKYDEATDIVSWDEVEGANYYKVTVNGSAEIYISNFAYWNYMNANEYNVTVEAIADGSILPSSANITFTKTTKSAESILITDSQLDLGLGGAAKVVFSINGNLVESTNGTLDFAAYREENPADEYVIKAKRVYADGTETSYTIEEKYVNKLAITGIYYEDYYVWFDKVAGAKYEIKVNDGESWVVDYPESRVDLEKSGINTIAIRAIVGENASEWATIEIDAIKITFDMNGGEEIAPIYAKKGDYLFLDISDRTGYDFAGFYLGGTYKNNKKLVDLNTASFDQDVTVTAAWKGKKYTVTYITNAMGTLTQATTEVTYGEEYQLEIPTAADAVFHFTGWFTGENGFGDTMADEFGRGTSWNVADNVTLYAFYRSAVDFNLLEDGTYEVIKGNAIDGMEEVVVPSVYNGKSVSTINAYAFQDSIYLKSIKLPNSIKFIDAQAFSGCTALASVTVYDAGVAQNDIIYESSEGVLILNNHSTSEKQLVFVPYGMEGTVTLPSTIEVIAAGAVLNTQISKIVIPASVRRIETAAFQTNPNLFEIEIAESVNGSTIAIQSEAFRGSSVKSLFIPAGAAIESLDFIKGCTSLEAINVSENNADYSSVDGVLFNKAQTKLIYYPVAKAGAYTVPSSVTEIAQYAFSALNANTVNGITTTPVTGLTEITINNRVETIGEYAFNNVRSLTKVTFTGLIGSEMVIGSYAFRGCSNLTTVEFNNQSKVKEIKSYAFSGTGLTSVTIPASVTLIENAAFQGIKATSIKFKGSEDATPLTIGTSSSDGQYAISNAVFSTANTVEFQATGLVFEEGCNIQVLNSGAFQGLYGLKEVTLPSSLTKVNAAAFYNCPTIEKINVNTASDVFVKAKNQASFYGSNSIKELVFMKDCAFITLANAFGNQSYEKITVAEGNTAYMATEAGNVYSADGKTLVYANASSITEIGVTDTTAEINGAAYNGNTTIVKLVIGANVETIAANAFEGCTELVEVEFLGGEKELSLGDAIFKGCTKLTTITFSERVTQIPANMFQNCTALERIDLSTGAIETIGVTAFNGCANLTQVNFGTQVEAIGNGAFYNCAKLENVTLPASVTTIGYIAGQAATNTAFSFNPDTLKSITVTGENAGLKVLNNTVILSGDGKYVYEALKSTTGEVVIPNTVEVIYSQAFKDCTGLTGLVFEKGGSASLEIGASTIGTGNSEVFSGCTGLTALEIPERCTFISGRAFYNCPVATLTFENAAKKVSEGAKELTIAGSGSSSTIFAYGKAANAPKFTEVVLPERLKSAAFIFYNNESVETIYLPADITVYGSNFLSGAIGLKKATFGAGSSVTTLPASMFNGCTSLVTIENMPSTITSFGSGAFTNCASLTSITIPAGIVEIASGLFSGCASLKNVTIEEGVQVIASKAFENCKALESVTIPTTVTTVGKKPSRGTATQNAFAGCTSLKTVTFADIQNSKCAEIALGAFMNCTSLESFEIPPLVTAIRGSVFKGCTSLKNVTYADATKITTIEASAFDGAGLVNFTFPDGVKTLTANSFANCTSLESVTLPKSLTAWLATAFTNCPKIASFSIDPANTTFSSADGALLKGTELSVYPAAKTSTSYMIPSSCRSVAANAFADNTYLTSIDYAGTSLAIGASAFKGTTNLKSFNFTYVVSIGANAFEGSGVNQVALGNSVTSIGNYAFLNCTSLISADLGYANATTLGTGIFKGCTKLAATALPNNSTKTHAIPANMYEGCTSLTNIEIPAHFTSMAANPFLGCTSLTVDTSKSTTFAFEAPYLYNAAKTTIYSYFGTETAIVIPNTVTTIGSYAFANTGITSLVSGTGLKTIQTGAFSGCGELTTVTLTNVTSLGASAFADNAKLTTVELGKVSSIGGNCFKNDKLIANLYIKSCVSNISENAFAGWVKGQKVWISSEYEKDNCMDEDGIGLGELFEEDGDFDSYQFLFQWGWEEE